MLPLTLTLTITMLSAALLLLRPTATAAAAAARSPSGWARPCYQRHRRWQVRTHICIVCMCVCVEFRFFAPTDLVDLHTHT